MPMMTAEQYEESLRRLNLVVYMFGKKLNNVVDDPIIRPSMQAVAKTYDMAHRPEHEDIMTATSHITGKDVVERFGEVSDLIIPYPEQPEEAPVVLVYKYDWGELRFGCSRDESDSLISVVLDAYESAACKKYKESNTPPGVFE